MMSRSTTLGTSTWTRSGARSSDVAWRRPEPTRSRRVDPAHSAECASWSGLGDRRGVLRPLPVAARVTERAAHHRDIRWAMQPTGPVASTARVSVSAALVDASIVRDDESHGASGVRHGEYAGLEQEVERSDQHSINRAGLRVRLANVWEVRTTSSDVHLIRIREDVIEELAGVSVDLEKPFQEATYVACAIDAYLVLVGAVALGRWPQQQTDTNELRPIHVCVQTYLEYALATKTAVLHAPFQKCRITNWLRDNGLLVWVGRLRCN